MTLIKVYIPKDSSARSIGADEVAEQIAIEAAARKIELEIIRNGTRGALWLEPLVEVEGAQGRFAFGPISPDGVAALFDANFLEGGAHPLSLGLTSEIPWFAEQERLTFSRVGINDPLSLASFEESGGLRGLRRALLMGAEEIINEVDESGVRGRGGAGFPTGIKWRTVLNEKEDKKYICCNADEGDSGTFADRILMEGDPFTLIEGMTIAALATGADEGFIYIRSEYHDANATMHAAITQAYEYGWLGKSVLGSDYRFDLHIRSGAGSYLCGEETAMLESLEGKRGIVRSKPPLPAIEGLFGKPSAINNVLTLAAIPGILSDGAPAYKSKGVGRSLGTQVFQLAGNIARGGVVELAFGVTLDRLVNGFGGGTRSKRAIRAVQVGGPLGAYLPTSSLSLSMDYESLLAAGGMLGHGGVVVFDESVNLAEQAKFAMEFCALESCGKCTPCRIGSTRGAEIIHEIMLGHDLVGNKKVLLDLCEVMTDGSLCAMGGLTPLPVKSALEHFPEDFELRSGSSV